MTEIIAIAADAQCKEDALTIAVREHARFVFKIAFSVLRNRDDAEDATQEAFLRAMKHRREFSKVEDQRAWLARTVWRLAIDRVRRKTNLSIEDAENERVIAQLRELEALNESPSAEAMMISAEMTSFVRTLIASLPPELREVITLSTVDEMTSAEISAVLEISDVTVRTRLMRARQLLREKLTAVLEPSGLNGSKQHFTGKSRVKI